VSTPRPRPQGQPPTPTSRSTSRSNQGGPRGQWSTRGQRSSRVPNSRRAHGMSTADPDLQVDLPTSTPNSRSTDARLSNHPTRHGVRFSWTRDRKAFDWCAFAGPIKRSECPPKSACAVGLPVTNETRRRRVGGRRGVPVLCARLRVVEPTSTRMARPPFLIQCSSSS
jgi:hypothetical protein